MHSGIHARRFSNLPAEIRTGLCLPRVYFCSVGLVGLGCHPGLRGITESLLISRLRTLFRTYTIGRVGLHTLLQAHQLAWADLVHGSLHGAGGVGCLALGRKAGVLLGRSKGRVSYQ